MIIADDVNQNGLRQRKPQEEEDIDTILQHHRQMHEKLAEELLHHTHNLKDFAYNSSAIVKKDVEVSSRKVMGHIARILDFVACKHQRRSTGVDEQKLRA